MKKVKILIFLLILTFTLIFLVGCSTKEIPKEIVEEEITDIPDITDSVNEEVVLEQDIPEIDPSNGLVLNLTMNSECRRDIHVMNLHYKLTRPVSNVTIEVKSEDSDDFKALNVYKSTDMSALIYFCDICPIESEMKIADEKDYLLRLKLAEGENILYSKEYSFSTKIGSEFMKEAICSAKEELGCQDSEETKNYKTRGVVTLGAEEYIENCYDTLHTYEYWCEDNEVKQEVIECKNRCWLGRCADID